MDAPASARLCYFYFTLFTLFAVDVDALLRDLRVGLFWFGFVVVVVFLVTAGVSGEHVDGLVSCDVSAVQRSAGRWWGSIPRTFHGGVSGFARFSRFRPVMSGGLDVLSRL